MKINKYFLGLAVAVLGGLSSCNTDAEGTLYNSDLEHVSFDGASASVSLSVDESSTTIPVTIKRGVITSASTFTFKAEASEKGIFSNDVNNTITFAPGQNSVTFNVKAANLEKEKSYTYTLSLSDAAVETADTITGVKQNKVYTIKVSREGDWTAWEKWKKEGTADYYYSGSFFGGDDPDLNFTYRKSMIDSNRMQFRLEHWGSDVTVIFDYDKSTGVVSCAPQYSGYSFDGIGDVMVTDKVNMCAIQGKTPEPSDYGKFDEEQGIITLPLAYYIPDFGNYLFGADPEYVYIDGYTRADYTLTVAYFGQLKTADDNNFLLADITFGKDVEYVLYALATEADADATLAGLIDGSIAGEKLKESGRVQVPVSESGTYYLIAVAFAGGEAVNFTEAKIKYTAGGEPKETWTPVFIGEYEYTVKDYTDDGESEPWGGWYPAGTKIDAILYQSDSDPTRWKIAPWAELTGEEGLIFTMDEDFVLTVDQVYTGYTSEKYGDVFASDFVTAKVTDMPSYYDKDSGVFYFNLAYHDAEDPWCLVQDTFTLTGEYEASSRAAKAIGKAKRSSHKITVKRGCKLARQYFAPIMKMKKNRK